MENRNEPKEEQTYTEIWVLNPNGGKYVQGNSQVSTRVYESAHMEESKQSVNHKFISWIYTWEIMF